MNGWMGTTLISEGGVDGRILNTSRQTLGSLSFLGHNLNFG